MSSSGSWSSAAGSRVDLGDLPTTITPRAPALEKRLFDDLPKLDEIERDICFMCFEHVGNNRTRAAEVMGMIGRRSTGWRNVSVFRSNRTREI